VQSGTGYHVHMLVAESAQLILYPVADIQPTCKPMARVARTHAPV